MLNLNKEDMEFLRELSHELKTQNKDCQASPRFWVVGDYEDRLVPEGEGDKVKFFLPDDCDEFSIEDIKDMLLEHDCINKEKVNEAFEDYDLLGDYDDIIDLVRTYIDDGAHVFYTERTHIIKKDTMFITKQSCQNHIKSNHYHYTKDAHTYAMTAWRSPEVEKLLKILEKIE